jgi:carnitine 3-dehydrogenase
VLSADEKRIHVFHTIVRGGVPAATAEQMLLHVGAASGRVGPAGEPVRERVTRLAAEHASLPRPERAGRRIGG